MKVMQPFSLRQKALSPLPAAKPRALKIARGHLSRLLEDHQKASNSPNLNHRDSDHVFASTAGFSF